MHEANTLARRIIGHAIEVHRHLGPGLSEIAYERALSREFTAVRMSFVRQVSIPVSYKGEVVAEYRPDFVVGELVVLEIKSVECLLPLHEAQMLTYLRVTGRELGLVLNFNVAVMRLGIKRVVLQKRGKEPGSRCVRPAAVRRHWQGTARSGRIGPMAFAPLRLCAP